MNKQLLVILALTAATIYGVQQFNLTDAPSTFLKSTQTSQIQQEFNEFMTTCQKTYSTEERIQRFATFTQNYIAIILHNTQSGESYKMGINCFADLNQIEFNLRRNQYQQSNNNVQILEEVSIPASVNWLTNGAVLPVKNQGKCGSCWAFSTICSTEGLQQITTGKLISLSEQELVDCSSSYGNNGCKGGLMDNGFKYIMANGITTEANYPYTAVVGTCQKKTSEFKINSYADIQAKSQSQFMAALAIQPVSVAIDASSYGFQLYHNGVYTGKGLFSGCKTTLDHGVAAIGYGSDNGKPYYLVRNSWGAKWGMQGYIQMANDGNGAGTCGIQLQASRPLM